MDLCLPQVLVKLSTKESRKDTAYHRHAKYNIFEYFSHFYSIVQDLVCRVSVESSNPTLDRILVGLHFISNYFPHMATNHKIWYLKIKINLFLNYFHYFNMTSILIPNNKWNKSDTKPQT